jgi:DHA2 family methylenomycin A resistance protein-like MFS transporter
VGSSVAPGRVLATVTAAQVLSVASATVVSVALPSIARDLGAGEAEQQWIVDAFVLVFASLLVAGGVLGDRRGRRDVFVAGLALFAAGSLWCALAPTVELLLVGRVLMALGPPLVLPASLAIVTATYADPARRARAIGLWGAGSGLGVATGPLLGGVLVELASWHLVFAINVPLALGLAVLALRTVPRDRPPRPATAFDGLGAVLLTAGVGLVVFALIEGRELGWSSPAVLGVAAAAVAMLVAFGAWERRHPAPLVDLALGRQGPFVAANVGGGLIFFSLLGAAVFFSLFFQAVQGRSALAAGLALLPQGLAIVVIAPVAGRLTGRLGPRIPMLGGLALQAAGLLLLVGVERSSGVADLAWRFAVLGAGAGLALPAMTVTAVSSVPAARTGMASAIHNASRQLGGTLGVAVLGSVVFGAAGFVDGLRAAMVLSAVLLGLGALVVLALVPRRRPARRGTAPEPARPSPP